MKKILAIMVVIAVFLVPMCFVQTVSAEVGGAEDVFVEGYNLAENEYNWLKPTVSMAKVAFSDGGIEFSNMTKDQTAATYYRGEGFGEFKMSLYIDANLNVPAEGSGADWRYSNMYITFLVNRTPENAIAEWALPWQTNRCYMSLQMGLDAYGTPLVTFVRYNAFANNCYEYYYVGTPGATNIADGSKHLVELEVRNFSEDGDSGKLMTCTVDGVKVAEYKYYDDSYFDATTNKEYDVEISKISGSFGIYTNSDWPTGTSPSKMNNTVKIEKLQIINYDNNPAGELVEQLSEPIFEVEIKDYTTQAGYETGELIEIKLSDLFTYEGSKTLVYTVTEKGNPIGQISSNGFWSWTPSAPGTYNVDFKCEVPDSNTVTNYLTLRVAAGEQPTDAPDTSAEPDGETGKGCGGCNSSGGAVAVLSACGMAAFVMFCRKGR